MLTTLLLHDIITYSSILFYFLRFLRVLPVPPQLFHILSLSLFLITSPLENHSITTISSPLAQDPLPSSTIYLSAILSPYLSSRMTSVFLFSAIFLSQNGILLLPPHLQPVTTLGSHTPGLYFHPPRLPHLDSRREHHFSRHEFALMHRHILVT